MFQLIQMTVRLLVRDERGVTLVEYGIALALAITLGAGAMVTLSGEIGTAMGTAGTSMPD